MSAPAITRVVVLALLVGLAGLSVWMIAAIEPDAGYEGAVLAVRITGGIVVAVLAAAAGFLVRDLRTTPRADWDGVQWFLAGPALLIFVIWFLFAVVVSITATS